jgi:S1-C subfamily serine protease
MAKAEPLAATFVNALGGMHHGDIILSVAGRRVKTLDEFQQELARFGPQSVVYFTVRRGENILQLPLRLAHGPASDSSVSMQEMQAAGNH